MQTVVQIVSSGMVVGGIYASLALALALVYRSTGLINFAQGEMALISTYVCLALIGFGLPYWSAFFLTLVLSFAFGAAVERLLVGRFYGRNHMVEVIVLIGFLTALQSGAGAIWSHNVRSFPSPFGSGSVELFGHLFRRHDLFAIAVTLALLVGVLVFFRATSLGLAMRATADNSPSSQLCGVPVSRMLATGWGLAAVVGAVSGMMVAPTVFLDPTMMSNILLYAFAATLIGGVGNPAGAVAGGFILGFAEAIFVALMPQAGNELKLSLVVLLIVSMLLVRPQGLFGERKVNRA